VECSTGEGDEARDCHLDVCAWQGNERRDRAPVQLRLELLNLHSADKAAEVATRACSNESGYGWWCFRVT
jgi:hypothetical protein